MTKMVNPRLLHPVDIILEQLDIASTYYDDDARESIQQVARKTSVTIKGQANWGAQMELSPTKTGAREGSRGYVLFRKVDLDAAGISLKDNDRFKKIGDIDTDVYVSRLEWLGHYPGHGGPTLVKAYFEDLRPAQQTRGVA